MEIGILGLQNKKSLKQLSRVDYGKRWGISLEAESDMEENILGRAGSPIG